MNKIDHLIINNPYEKPKSHWDTKTFEKKQGRRSAGYLFVTADEENSTEFYPLELVNKIRKSVDAWRENNYDGITKVTRKLLEHWNNPQMREYQFFFCQLESIETLIWLTEAPDHLKQGIEIPSDGGTFKRICAKMATGTGKTYVMGMLIAWQVINKVTYPSDKRFTRNFLVMAPGLTVKERLQGLLPNGKKRSVYDEFNIVPPQYFEKMHLAKIVIHNWHQLMPLQDKKNNVVKLGPESNESFTKRVLGNTSSWNNFIVINDEAHHAWRPKVGQTSSASDDEEEEAKRWVQGLDILQETRNIVACYDFSATPMIPYGTNKSQQVFDWIVSDFSLSDAIESGLVKTPRITITQDENDGREFYHLYSNDDVKIDLRKRRKPVEPLPSLVKNAYLMLGQHWKQTREKWKRNNKKTPPVMITVCNTMSTASRVEYSFINNTFGLNCLGDEEKILRIDSNVLNEESEKKEESVLRKKVDTIGKIGKPGEQIENIVAVAMLSEGWDANTVTHIMGLRAFSSQLLCEQVIGRGLRRTSYDLDKKSGLFLPEYVTVFGIPYAFLPHEQDSEEEPKEDKPSTYIEPVASKKEYKISWPNILRVNTNFSPKLSVNWDEVGELRIDARSTIGKNMMADALEGKTSDRVSVEDLEKLGMDFRMQSIIFQTTKNIFDSVKYEWEGDKDFLLLQLVKIVEQFISSEKIKVINIPDNSEIRKKVTLMVHMDKIVRYIIDVIKYQNTESRSLEFDPTKKIKSTEDVRPYYTTKKCVLNVTRSHMNHGVYDTAHAYGNAWEKRTIEELESNPNVISWVKNDRKLFEIEYNWFGKPQNYWPDFLIRLRSGKMLILEIKGIDEPEGKEKRARLDDWVTAVNEDGNYGSWTWSIAFIPEQVVQIIKEKTESARSEKDSANCDECRKTSTSREEVEKLFGYENIDGFAKPKSLCRDCENK